MSFYRGRLKTLTVLGGVALVLLSCLQQARAICFVNGCVESAASAFNCDSSAASCCAQCNANAIDSCGASQSPDHPGEPCNHDCSCCKAPAPRIAPRDMTQQAKAQLTSEVTSCSQAANLLSSVDCVECDLLAPLQADAASESPLAVCALLCRYLI